MRQFKHVHVEAASDGLVSAGMPVHYAEGPGWLASCICDASVTLSDDGYLASRTVAQDLGAAPCAALVEFDRLFSRARRTLANYEAPPELAVVYGPGTGVDAAPSGGPVHVHAAADAARKALTTGAPGIYNIAEEDGAVSSAKAIAALGWQPTFRLNED